MNFTGKTHYDDCRLMLERSPYLECRDCSCGVSYDSLKKEYQDLLEEYHNLAIKYNNTKFRLENKDGL